MKNMEEADQDSILKRIDKDEYTEAYFCLGWCFMFNDVWVGIEQALREYPFYSGHLKQFQGGVLGLLHAVGESRTMACIRALGVISKGKAFTYMV